MLRVVKNVSWRDRMPNRKLYGHLLSLSSIVRQRPLALAGHVMRDEEPATSTLIWEPEENWSSPTNHEGCSEERHWSGWGRIGCSHEGQKTLARRFYIVTGVTRGGLNTLAYIARP